uniref:Uncharacterized protein n=1 Tax=Cacopsylla melanoneura TaxID=428564 RepID=A0A8D8PLT6_9HEMI
MTAGICLHTGLGVATNDALIILGSGYHVRFVLLQCCQQFIYFLVQMIQLPLRHFPFVLFLLLLFVLIVLVKQVHSRESKYNQRLHKRGRPEISRHLCLQFTKQS